MAASNQLSPYERLGGVYSIAAPERISSSEDRRVG